MSNKTVEDFEAEFYPFVKLLALNPSRFQQNNPELKRILSHLLAIKNPDDLEIIVQGFRNNGLFKLQFYPNTWVVIWEVERNLLAAALKIKKNHLSDGPWGPGGRISTSVKNLKAALDFVKR